MSWGPPTAYGTQLEDFETVGDWTVAQGTGAADTTNFRSGTQSLRLTPTTAGVGPYATKAVTYSPPSHASSPITLWVYCHDVDEHGIATDITSLTLYFGNDTTWTDYVSASYPGSGLHLGWNLLTWTQADFAATGAGSLASPVVRVRVRVYVAAGTSPEVSVDDLRIGLCGTPGVLFTFDDCYATAYTEGVTYLATKGINATLFVAQSIVDGGGSFITSDQVELAHASGCLIASHTYDNVDLTTLTQAEAEEELAEAAAWLTAQGWGEGAAYLSFPYGYCNAGTLAAMDAVGIKFGRNAMGRLCGAIIDDARQVSCKNVLINTTLATCTGLVDKAVSMGTTVVFLYHSFADAAVLADFKSLVDYVVTSGARTGTVADWYTAQDVVPGGHFSALRRHHPRRH